MMPQDVVVATHNAGKVAELQEMLAAAGWRLHAAGALGLPAPVENGGTFLANARLKAEGALAALGERSLTTETPERIGNAHAAACGEQDAAGFATGGTGMRAGLAGAENDGAAMGWAVVGGAAGAKDVPGGGGVMRAGGGAAPVAGAGNGWGTAGAGMGADLRGMAEGAGAGLAGAGAGAGADNAALAVLGGGMAGAWVLADDSGLEVAALAGAPGVETAHFGGPQVLLEALRGVPEGARRARFVCVLALARPGHETLFFEGRCAGAVAAEARGNRGFAYDPVFIPAGDTRTFAEMGDAEKNAYSHRGKAMARLLAWVEANRG